MPCAVELGRPPWVIIFPAREAGVRPPRALMTAVGGGPYNALGVAYNGDMTATRATVSRNGQVSVPAAVRHRWGTRSVLVIDRGDYAIVRPIPDDPVTALEGAYAGSAVTAEEARAAERAAEEATEQRRLTDR